MTRAKSLKAYMVEFLRRTSSLLRPQPDIGILFPHTGPWHRVFWGKVTVDDETYTARIILYSGISARTNPMPLIDITRHGLFSDIHPNCLGKYEICGYRKFVVQVPDTASRGRFGDREPFKTAKHFRLSGAIFAW